MPVKLLVFSFLFFVGTFSYSQSKLNIFLTPSDSLNKVRKKTVYVIEASAAGLALVGLNQLWYADYPQSKFHFFNDNNEWMQLDKIGHFYSTYHVGRFGAELLAWSGASKKEQLCYGATLGFGFLTAVEVFDGFSQEWGFSWGDMLANTSGTGLYITQELLWKEQRIIPKFSFHKTSYAAIRPETLGSSLNEQLLKDYNGQTYWLSFNLYSFIKNKHVPKWLNLAVGYGAEGMLYGNNKEAIADGFSQNPNRQLYLSLDVDLTKIETKSHFLKTVFSLFNTVKIPAPTLELGDFNGVKGHLVYF
ncbi:DUF2279 domain-containing protein [Flavobacterium sediminis]|uniref:DUF2279 domain-containing protein n=1 Tax=Flavobacterium sediminis TaxID=2201181 RepID=A0A2U8QZC1_9FLAO|nr:DUF2279 domain-containing protein [Flavobacterium sediminis]